MKFIQYTRKNNTLTVALKHEKTELVSILTKKLLNVHRNFGLDWMFLFFQSFSTSDVLIDVLNTKYFMNLTQFGPIITHSKNISG